MRSILYVDLPHYLNQYLNASIKKLLNIAEKLINHIVSKQHKQRGRKTELSLRHLKKAIMR